MLFLPENLPHFDLGQVPYYKLETRWKIPMLEKAAIDTRTCKCFPVLDNFICTNDKSTQCKVGGFYGSDYEECRLLGCYAV
jgi:hypothetical protein